MIFVFVIFRGRRECTVLFINIRKLSQDVDSTYCDHANKFENVYLVQETNSLKCEILKNPLPPKESRKKFMTTPLNRFITCAPWTYLSN